MYFFNEPWILIEDSYWPFGNIVDWINLNIRNHIQRSLGKIVQDPP